MRKINWNSELHQRWNFARGQNEQIQQPARTFNVLHLLYLSIVFINQYQSLNSCMIRLLFSILYLELILQHIFFRLKGQLTYYEPFPGVMEFLTQFLCYFRIERNSINLFECCFFRQQNAAGQSLLSLKILWSMSADAFSFCKRWPPKRRLQWLCTIWSNFSAK